MGTLNEALRAQKEKLEAIAAAQEEQTTALTGIVDDVAWLKEKIEELQNTPGPISPEDQALLDEIQAKLDTTTDKATALKDAMAALNAQTERPTTPPPPEPPTEPTPAG